MRRSARDFAVVWLVAIACGIGVARAGDPTVRDVPGRATLPVINIAHPGKCVAPTDVMRRDHMKFILHQRDETVHRGIRTTRFSLANCVNCHADLKTHSVLGKDGFCQSCHTYAAVSIDCFSCHSSSPEKVAERAPPPRAGAGISNGIANRGTSAP